MQRSFAGLVLGASLLLPAASLLLPGAAAALTAEDLVGSWHVLAHYKDSASDHPDRERWVDRVWKFEWDGQKLQWTDYPIVVFDDETGRFERLGTNRQSRILHHWIPNEGQIENIQRGLEVNQRGAKSKSLEKTAEGWSSEGDARPQSMNFLTYVETWSIEGLPDRPVFQRSDSLSSGLTETLEGVTRYSTEAIGPDGNLLSGRYERDGTQQGTFRMMRSGGTEWVKGSGKTPNQRFQEMAVSQYAASPRYREDLREVFEESLAEGGIVLREEDLDRFVDRIAGLQAEGRSPEEIQEIIDGELISAVLSSFYAFAPEGAVHDAAVRYGLPFDAPAPRRLLGQGRDLGLSEELRHSWVFETREGDPVVAARGGKVVVVVDEYERGGMQKSLAPKANAVLVLHDDGSFASYVHLARGALVKEGDGVTRGQRLGTAGRTGYTPGPRLAFAVWTLDDEGRPRTVPIRFDGVAPSAGGSYGGPGWKASGP